MRAGTNPDVQRLIKQESEHIAATGAELAKEYGTGRETIGATLAILGLRQRYFALIGEHFSVFDFDGITAMDALDERLLFAVNDILQKRGALAGDAKAEEDLDAALANLREVPQHPVGYMVLFQVRKIFEAFDGFVQTAKGGGDEKVVERHEKAFLDRVARVIEAYVTGRKTPVTRHFSELAREYAVVSRLHCPCGQAKYKVETQSLITDPDGSHVDRLDVKCAACGQSRALEFPLPYFGDLTIA